METLTESHYIPLSIDDTPGDYRCAYAVVMWRSHEAGAVVVAIGTDPYHEAFAGWSLDRDAVSDAIRTGAAGTEPGIRMERVDESLTVTVPEGMTIWLPLARVNRLVHTSYRLVPDGPEAYDWDAFLESLS